MAIYSILRPHMQKYANWILFCGLLSQVLEERLLEIYRTLKRVHSTDEDYVVRLQAQTSLDALNENMKEILTLKPTLEKKIRVFDKF